MANNNIIELVNVTKSFDGDIVLDNINLKIKDGEDVYKRQTPCTA